MPGLPLAVRENPNSGHYQIHSRTVDLSAKEAIAAEESFEVYCKPVELYNILQRRSIKNLLFPQRCLSYKTEAKRKRRVHMTISLSGILNAGVEVQKILSLHILLARPNPYIATGGQHHTVYILKQACIIAASSEFESRGRYKATFILPEIKKLLAEAASSKLTILFVSAEKKNMSYERNPCDNSNNKSYPSVGGYCLCGKIPIEFLNWTPETCVNLSSVNGAELLSTVDMKSCFSDIEKSEDADGSDPRKQTFVFCPKPHKRRRSNNLSGNGENVHPHVIGSLFLEVAGKIFLEDLLGKEDGASYVPMPSTRSPLGTPSISITEIVGQRLQSIGSEVVLIP